MKAHHLIRHGIDFGLLVLILGLGLAGMMVFRYELASQIAVVILMSIMYVFWGVFHHLHDNDLTGKVVLEYIAMAALISFILILFLLRV